MPEKEAITGIILAGGEGRRLNHADKGLLFLDGRQLIDYVVEAIRPQVKEFYISANRSQELYREFTANVFSDDEAYRQNGPLGGLATLLPKIRTEFALMVPCDTPNLPADLVQQLAVAFESDSKLEISIARSDNQDQYLIALMKTSLQEKLVQYLQIGERSVKGWLETLSWKRVELRTVNGALANINKPQDLRSYIASPHKLKPDSEK